MHPAVVAAVLLLVGTINTVTAWSTDEVQKMCKDRSLESCGRGCKAGEWIRMDCDRCVKYFKIPSTFHEAQDYCHSVNAELVSIHDEEEMILVMCLSLKYNSDSQPQPFWSGGKRSGGGFIYTDGSEFDYARWLPEQPDNHRGQEGCVEMNVWYWGSWNDQNCSVKKDFFCQKRA
ncbi:C-type isolectin Sp-CL4-like [Cebidichthys violaceus]|uniref:C-type isolectin Sp-CL4-like n=1 Tax=Cebidichthys violaceus TaxID=271503 RepID=UPI0035CB302A